MGRSWHAFFFGALEPGGSLAIDKPPVDLWLQVAATKTLGYGALGLHLPEALGGIAACGLLYGALYRPFGFLAALLAALALAILPLAVITARSDTMDSLLAALLSASLWLSWRALESGRARWSLLAAAVLGVAFNVKLGEALIALPALALLWLWGAPTLTARLRVAGASAAAFLLVALSWTALASLTPASQRPFPVGSGNGSIWRVTLIYNGLDRLSGRGAVGGASLTAAGAPGPLRLLSTGPLGYWTPLGAAVLGALLLGALALYIAGGEQVSALLLRPQCRFLVGIGVWFLTGLILFSAMRRLQLRYLEAFAPAVCAVLGLSLSVLLRNGPLWRRALPAALALLLLGAWMKNDVQSIEQARSDSLLSDPSSPALSRYLRAHQDGARYEVASANVNEAVGLIARDGGPVLVLTSVDGAITHVGKLRGAVAAGQVRFYFAPHGCHSGRHCPASQRWAYANSVPVPHLHGLRRFNAGARAHT